MMKDREKVVGKAGPGSAPRTGDRDEQAGLQHQAPSVYSAAMLRFFRHIRRDALTNHRIVRYSWYALGEILLVVVGILIALQINNWNEEQIEQRQIRGYLLKLAADLKRDVEMVDPVAQQIRRVIHHSDELADYVRERSIEEIENAELFFLTSGMGYRPYSWNRAALEQLKSSGAMRQIANDQLTDRISAYDALTHHLDQDHENDQRKIEEVELVANRVIDRNYPERAAINTWLYQIGDEDLLNRTRAFRDTVLFENMKQQDLPLLTDDGEAIRLLVNQMLNARADLDSRVDLELPRLRGWADEIIALIEADYR